VHSVASNLRSCHILGYTASTGRGECVRRAGRDLGANSLGDSEVVSRNFPGRTSENNAKLESHRGFEWNSKIRRADSDRDTNVFGGAVKSGRCQRTKHKRVHNAVDLTRRVSELNLAWCEENRYLHPSSGETLLRDVAGVGVGWEIEGPINSRRVPFCPANVSPSFVRRCNYNRKLKYADRNPL
jgi:hypothetical protein